MNTSVLQIVPQLPGSYDGVGDYALILARALRRDYQLDTIFVVANRADLAEKENFAIVAGLDSLRHFIPQDRHAILHYANYGYQTRGVPFHLRNRMRALRGSGRGRWITTFHELYAFGPPWRSAFWLYPLQVKIARDIIDRSDSCVVSSDVIEQQVHARDPRKPVQLLPVMSNFGEPELNSSLNRSSNHWAICGGTSLILRSLRCFPHAQQATPTHYRADELEVIGGRASSEVRDAIATLRQTMPRLSCRYHPEVEPARASELLGKCSFAWIDYFAKGKVWPGMIYKSGSFAACCAHGVLPILSHAQPPPPVNGDAFPEWYFASAEFSHFPDSQQLVRAREKIYAWYHRNASAQRTARAYAEALA
ncbi:MAG TPA: hypothetical protein VFO30_02375 [Chthoniobacterales bacterium]|nr:hypothetical protein [Chthoniobacterales bacterium]